MNGYDFDKTIYNGDSFTQFFFFTILKNPLLALFLPFQLLLILLHLCRLISKKHIKELLMINLKFFKNKEILIEKFWDKHIKNIKEWYFNQKKPNDIIISASPYFLVAGACKRLGLSNVIASEMELNTLKIIGKNCWGKEKAVRFEKQFPLLELEEFYSDNLSDMPMMKKAKRGILVSGNNRKVVFEKDKN